MRAFGSIVFGSFLFACSPAPIVQPAAAPVLSDAGVTAPSIPAPPSCEERIREQALAAPSTRHVEYTAALPEVIVHTRIDPVLFLRWPDESARGSEATALRRRLEESARPTNDVRALIASRPDRALLREVLLSDGYLFAARPALALALSSEVQLTDLFDAPAIYRSRDGVIDALELDGDHYTDTDGSIARLRLNDRVTDDDAALSNPLGVDLEVVREQTGALRTLPTALGSNTAAIDLVFPNASRRPALVQIHDGATDVICIGGDMQTLQSTLDDAARFWRRHEAITAAARAFVEESERFDEPINEPEGVQEDGKLRAAWARAYAHGERTFFYRDVEYPVFDSRGRATPPQVCIDFVIDSWERGSGTWFSGRDETPGRTEGSLDLMRVPELPRRNLTWLLDYTALDHSVLDRVDFAEEDRVPLAEGAPYAQAVARIADDIREGDALIIYGLRLQDMHMHHHAILVLRTEPMTGVPMVIADNQGRPHLRTLVSAMRAAPLRSIQQRLRLAITEN